MPVVCVIFNKLVFLIQNAFKQFENEHDTILSA